MNCPYCNSNDSGFVKQRWNGEDIGIMRRCNKCLKAWVMVYKLSSIVKFDDKGKEDQYGNDKPLG